MTDPISLLPPNATPTERAVERLVFDMGPVPIPVRDVWNPDTCPPELLPWLAWSLGVYVWKSGWSIRRQRSVVRNAIAIKRRQGTASSVRDIVAPFGELVIKEWWEMDPPGEPFTFQLVMNATDDDGEPLSADAFEEVMAHVHRAKPVRSWFTATQGIAARAGLAFAAIGRPVLSLRLSLDGVFSPPPEGEGALDFSHPANSGLMAVL